VPDTLAPDADLALFPVDVVEFQVHHLSSAQTEPRQEEQDRIIALAHGGVLRARLEQALDVVRFKKLRDL
jgi:hypothetical protein